MDKKTLKHRRIRIPNDRRIFYPNQIKLFKISWNNKYLEENGRQKKINWATKKSLDIMMDIERKELDHGYLVEFLNTFVIKGSKIFFEKERIMYVISK